jgi:hypothetical protein
MPAVVFAQHRDPGAAAHSRRHRTRPFAVDNTGGGGGGGKKK